MSGTTNFWPRAATCADGVPYLIRPICRADAQLERDFLMNLTADSRYQRFMYTVREPSAEFVAQLVDIDLHASMALVALTGAGADEKFIAVARYAADSNGLDCEFAVAVADAWQCRGIGANLTRLLFEHAAREGFHSIYGNVLANNPRMLELAEFLGLSIEPLVDGESTVRASRRLS